MSAKVWQWEPGTTSVFYTSW